MSCSKWDKILYGLIRQGDIWYWEFKIRRYSKERVQVKYCPYCGSKLNINGCTKE